jgi:hypothetical protein
MRNLALMWVLVGAGYILMIADGTGYCPENFRGVGIYEKIS